MGTWNNDYRNDYVNNNGDNECKMTKCFNFNHMLSIRRFRKKIQPKDLLYEATDIIVKLKHHGLYDMVLQMIENRENDQYLMTCNKLNRTLMQEK